MRMSGLAFLAIVVLMLAAPAARAGPAWVQLGPQGAEARALADSGACPPMVVDGKAAPMRLRAAPDAAFPVAVCEAPIPRGARSARIEGQALPLPRAVPRRILIFGDTGCRIKGRLVQDCSSPRTWPFAQIARKAAAAHPDLVIHVGDYYYRETPCPADHAECAGSPYGDKWVTWKAEFFDPAQPLLASVPFVFARGNHESCDRGGKGWFRLLDAAPQPLACPATSAPFRVDLGGVSLYVVDSADADDRRATPDAVAAFSAQLDALEPDLASRPGWIVTHRPFWASTPLVRIGPIGPLETTLNATEQAAAGRHDLSAVQMVISGHVHHFASYTFGPRRPAQLVVGTGGDIGEDADLAAMREVTPTLDGRAAKGLTFDRFGYFLLDRTGSDWVGAFHDLNDRVIATCRLRGRAIACRPVR